MPIFTPSTPSEIRSRAPSNVATLPAISSTSGSVRLIGHDRLHHPLGVAVSGVDHQHVHVLGDQLLRPFQEVAGGADGRAHAQPALGILGGVGILDLLLDVLDGDQALQGVIVVHHQQLFHAVPVQNLLRLLRESCRREP